MQAVQQTGPGTQAPPEPIRRRISSFLARSVQEIVRQIRAIYDNYGFDTQILVASVRNPMHVVEAALMGADVLVGLSVAGAVTPEMLKGMVQSKFVEGVLTEKEARE